MNSNKRFSVCGTLRKQDCIELLKNNLTAEELKTAIITPNYNQLVRLLKALTKKENQFLLYNTHKIGMDKISNIIRKNAVIGGGDSEEEEEEEAEDNKLKKSTNTNNLIDIDEDNKKKEININTDLLTTNIIEVKKKSETIQTQTDNIKHLNQLQLEYIENNNKLINESSNKKETRHTKPTSLKKTITIIPQQKYNDKLIISNEPISDKEINIISGASISNASISNASISNASISNANIDIPINEKQNKNIETKNTAELFMKTNDYNEIKKITSLNKVVSILKNAKLNYQDCEKVCNTLMEYHRERLLKDKTLDTEFKTHIQEIKKIDELYDLCSFI